MDNGVGVLMRLIVLFIAKREVVLLLLLVKVIMINKLFTPSLRLIYARFLKICGDYDQAIEYDV